MNPGKAACLSGFNFPFQPEPFKKIMTIQFEDPAFIILYALNSYISWVIYFEKLHSTRYIDDVLQMLCNINQIANLNYKSLEVKKGAFKKTKDGPDLFMFPDMTALSFFHMYSILLESKVYKFGENFFKILEQYIQNNISRSNMIFNYLCQTIPHIIQNQEEMQHLLKLIGSTVKLAESNKINVDSTIIDSIINAIDDLLIKMDKYALEVFRLLIPLCNIRDHNFIFNQISVTLFQIILNESEYMEWPSEHNQVIKIEMDIENQPTSSINDKTFKHGIPDFTPIKIERDSDYALFCSKETLDKITLFLTSISNYDEPSLIFVSSLFNEVRKHTELDSLPQVYSIVIFVCKNLIGSLSSFNAALILAQTAIFDPSVSIFDNPTHFKTMSRLRLETITIAINQGAEFFNGFMNYLKMYPKIIGEVFYRLCDIASLYYLLIKRDPKAIRGMMQPIFYYSHISNLKDQTHAEIIEKSRIAQFTFLNLILKSKDCAELLYQDMDFANCFVGLLFENNLRPYILSCLLDYFKEAEPNSLNYIIGPLVTIFANTRNDFSDPSFLTLLNDTISMLSQFHHSRKGMASVVGPIHEGINIMIHVMPPNESTEKILFTCIDLFIEAGDDNMLSSESMTMLSASIINFYKGHPTDELYHKLVQLFIGDASSEQKPEFEINNKLAMILLYQVFINSIHSMKLLDFFSKLFDYKVVNCLIAHKIKFDFLLLNSICDFRASGCEDIEKLKKIIHLFKQIAIQSTSKKIFNCYLSNLAPSSENKPSQYHNLFVRCLYDMIYEQYKTYNYSIFLETEKTMIATSGSIPALSYIFWITTNDDIHEKTVVMNIKSHGTLIVLFIEDNKLYADLTDVNIIMDIGPIVKTLWSFVCISIEYADNKYKILTNIDFTCNINSFTFEAPNQETFASMLNCKAEISYLAIFPPLKHELRQIYSAGPFANAIQHNLVIAIIQKPFNDICFPKKSISSIITKKCSFLSLIKLAKNAANDVDSTLYYISCFTKLSCFNTEAQKKLLELNFMQAFSDFLRSEQITLTYELYLSLYNYFICITNADLKDSIFKYILSEPLIWNNSSPNAHENIVNHWSRVLFKSFMPNAAKLRPFSQLFEHFNFNYFLSMSSRASFQTVLITVASETFDLDDFTNIISYISSCTDEEFGIYLMQFLNILMLEIPEKFKSMQLKSDTVGIFQLLMNTNDDKMMASVIDSVVQFEKLTNDEDLVRHLDALMFYMLPEKCNELFFAKISDLLMNDTPELLSMNCWAAIHCPNFDYKFLKEIFKTINVEKRGAWMFWPLIVAIRVPDLKDDVIRFLFRANGEFWYPIITNAYLACEACGVKIEDLLPDIFFIAINEKASEDITGYYENVIDTVVWYISHVQSQFEDSLIFRMLKENHCGIVVFDRREYESAVRQQAAQNQVVGPAIAARARNNKFKRKISYTQSVNYSTPNVSELGLFRHESFDNFMSPHKRRKKKGPKDVISITDLKTIINENELMSIHFGMRVDTNGNWQDLPLAVSLCDFAAKYFEAVQNVSDDTIDRICWLLVNVAKFDQILAKNCAQTILNGRESAQPFINNLSKMTSIGLFRRIYETPLRSELVENVFETEIEHLLKFCSKFFDVLLPSFTKSVMQFISEFEKCQKNRKKVVNQMIDECNNAHQSLLKLL